MTGKTNGMPDSRSYRDAVVAHMPPPPPPQHVIRAPPANRHQADLKNHLRNLLRRHPEGMLLAQLRRSSRLLFQPEVLGSYASTTELLCSMSDVLYMRGVGVQTRVYPVDV